jgi:hypothetical protein
VRDAVLSQLRTSASWLSGHQDPDGQSFHDVKLSLSSYLAAATGRAQGAADPLDGGYSSAFQAGHGRLESVAFLDKALWEVRRDRNRRSLVRRLGSVARHRP